MQKNKNQFFKFPFFRISLKVFGIFKILKRHIIGVYRITVSEIPRFTHEFVPPCNMSKIKSHVIDFSFFFN